VITTIGHFLIITTSGIREFFILLKETLIALVSPPFRWKETIQQLYFVANGSLLIVTFCVAFAAIVTILESSFHMKMVIQNDSMVPGFASMLILRELGAESHHCYLLQELAQGLLQKLDQWQLQNKLMQLECSELILSDI
jgi:phospholipid/cholesterol/gamma-HCH transport system permease protein